eukprot:5644683-Pleurochrysis_carterae.AAC.1
MPDNVFRLANQRLSLAGVGTDKAHPAKELFVRQHLPCLFYHYHILRFILLSLTDGDTKTFSYLETLLDIYLPTARASTFALTSQLEQ